MIVQPCERQSAFMSRFNPTSVNTIRIATYKSVIDDDVHVLSIVVRMGSKGKFIDNLHGGGRMVRIDENGRFADYCIDQYGTKFNEHNEVRFPGNELQIPNMKEVLRTVKELSSRLAGIRLIQWDIMLDEKEQPKVLEFNIGGFSMWIAQMTGTPALGRFTDEVIEYIRNRTKEK